MRFEWDSNKNEINIQKHGISFEQAREIFFDERSVYVPARIIDGEERVAAIGMIENQKVYVCIHVLRDGMIRIISARRARANEEEIWRTNQ